jgi:hypothetical protein
MNAVGKKFKNKKNDIIIEVVFISCWKLWAFLKFWKSQKH